MEYIKQNFNTYAKISFLVTLIAIEYLATTTLEIKPLQHTWDKANHFIAFFTLYILLSSSHPTLSSYAKFSLLLLFGLHIEIVQYFIPNRDFSLFDVFADSIGIMIGYITYTLIKKILIKV